MTMVAVKMIPNRSTPHKLHPTCQNKTAVNHFLQHWRYFLSFSVVYKQWSSG